MMQHKGGKTSNRLPCTFPESGGDWALMGWGWGRFMVGPEVWLRWFSHTLSGAVCGHHAWYPAFAPGTSESLVFGLYHLIVRNLPRVHMHAVIFFVPYHFFVFCCLRRQLSRYKCAEFLNHVRLFATPWTVAHQEKLSTFVPDSPGKNTGVGCHAFLQGIFLTQGLNPGLPHCRWILHHLNHQGSSSRYKQCNKGTQIPACLRFNWKY